MLSQRLRSPGILDATPHLHAGYRCCAACAFAHLYTSFPNWRRGEACATSKSGLCKRPRTQPFHAFWPRRGPMGSSGSNSSTTGALETDSPGRSLSLSFPVCKSELMACSQELRKAFLSLPRFCGSTAAFMLYENYKSNSSLTIGSSVRQPRFFSPSFASKHECCGRGTKAGQARRSSFFFRFFSFQKEIEASTIKRPTAGLTTMALGLLAGAVM